MYDKENSAYKCVDTSHHIASQIKNFKIKGKTYKVLKQPNFNQNDETVMSYSYFCKDVGILLTHNFEQMSVVKNKTGKNPGRFIHMKKFEDGIVYLLD